MKWWQQWLATWDPNLRKLYEDRDEMLDRHARERAEMDQYKAEVFELIQPEDFRKRDPRDDS